MSISMIDLMVKCHQNNVFSSFFVLPLSLKCKNSHGDRRKDSIENEIIGGGL